MIYIPNTYNNDLVGLRFYDLDEFVRLQKKYRKALEEYLDKRVHLKEVEQTILDSGLDIPKVEDQEYNFYHQSEVLTSGYLFVRNNIHIEKLSEEDLKYLKETPVLDEKFIEGTIPTVIFEDGYHTFFGNPTDENRVDCKSVIMEFTYDMVRCKDDEVLFGTMRLKDKIQELLQERFKQAQIPLSYLVYVQIPDYFIEDKKKVTK